MATDLNYINTLSNKLIYRIFLSRKCLANIWYIIKPCPFCLFATIVFLLRFWKKQPNFLVKIANKSFHTTAQNCITYWILIIPISQGKRLLPYIIAEKTSQRNQNSNVFICPSFRAFLLLFCRVPKRCIFYGKCRFIDIWHACPE